MRKLSTLALALILSATSFAEGTRETSPTGNEAYLNIGRTTIVPNREFALYDGNADERLYFHIHDFNNEVLHIGLNKVGAGDMEFRIKDPSGTVVFGPFDVPTTGAGFINSYTEAITGPAAILAGGYNSIVFDPVAEGSLVNGDYYIEFDNGNAASGKDVPQVERNLRWYDFTIENTATNSALPGRLWSRAWGMTTDAFTTPYEGTFYTWSNDSIVSSLNLNGLRALEFTASFNSYGASVNPDPLIARQSIVGQSNQPEFPVFLNDPDISVWPSGVAPSLGATPMNMTGCANNYCINESNDLRMPSCI